jgi:G3E family GTPase
MAAIPALVVTGPLGSGKTTVIARLLAGKPAAENWVVLLNEFSDAGIDALTVAAAARGAYDVRLVPGGCLCCAGEQDFRRNLAELLGDVRPDRILVEPSGLGHPAGIVEELLAHEARGALRLESVLAVLDAPRVAAGAIAPGTLAHDQAEISDALVLTKADLADAATLAQFRALATAFYPPKRWLGTSVRGELPEAAWACAPGASRARLAATAPRPALHAAERAAHADDLDGHEPQDEVQSARGRRATFRHLGHAAARWIFPRSVEFSRERLGAALGTANAATAAVRVKGVLRVAEDAYVLVQHDGRTLDIRESAWRRESRIEVLVESGDGVEWSAWDTALSRCQVDC